MTSTYNEIFELLAGSEKDNAYFQQVFRIVWDRMVYLLTMNGTLVKTKGEANINKDFLISVIKSGIVAFYNPTESAKQNFKDMINLMSYDILDDYNLKQYRNEDVDTNEQEQETKNNGSDDCIF